MHCSRYFLCFSPVGLPSKIHQTLCFIDFDLFQGNLTKHGWSRVILKSFYFCYVHSRYINFHFVDSCFINSHYVAFYYMDFHCADSCYANTHGADSCYTDFRYLNLCYANCNYGIISYITIHIYIIKTTFLQLWLSKEIPDQIQQKRLFILRQLVHIFW